MSEQDLINNGFKVQTFFYAIGGGEDEDDMDIWVKDGIAVAWNKWKQSFVVQPYESLNYINGFNLDNAKTVNSIEEVLNA